AACGIRIESARRLMQVSRRPISLDCPLPDAEERSLGELLKDSRTSLAAVTSSQESLAQLLGGALDGLSERERDILSKRFGLNGSPIHTLEEVGRALRLTRERIRQI